MSDGTKIQANNAKDNNFTKNKLDDRIKWLNGHTDEYLRILSEMDEQEEADGIPGELTRESLEAKLKEAQTLQLSASFREERIPFLLP